MSRRKERRHIGLEPELATLDDQMHHQDPAFAAFMAFGPRNTRMRVVIDKLLLRLPWHPRRLVHHSVWWALGLMGVIATIIVVALSIPDHPAHPCGPGSTWASISVGTTGTVGHRQVSAMPKGPADSPEHILVTAPPGPGHLKIISVNDYDGATTGTSLPIGSTGVLLDSAKYVSPDGTAGISSADVCRYP